MAELDALNVKIDGDASGLRAAVRVADEAAAKLANTVKFAATSAVAFRTAFNESAGAAAAFRKTIDASTDAGKNYNAEVKRLDSAIAAGTITRKRANSEEARAAAAYSKAAAAANNANIAKLEKEVKDAADSAVIFQRAFDKSATEVDSLRASLDPLYASSKRYEQAVNQLDAAVRSGAITRKQATALEVKASAAYLTAGNGAAAMSKSMGQLGNISGQTRARIQNTSFQLQDIAVQLQSGTSLTTTLSQQLPQLAGGFGAVGAVIGVLAAVGIPALSFAMGGLMNKSKSAKDSMEDLETSISDMNSAATSSQNIDELKKKYGELAEEAQEAFAAMSLIAQVKGAEEFAAGIADIRKDVAGLGVAGWMARKFLDEPTNKNMFNYIQSLAEPTDVLAKKFGITNEKAGRLAGSLAQLDSEGSVKSQAIAAGDLRDTIASLYNDITKMPAALRAMHKASSEAAAAGIKLAGSAGGTEGNKPPKEPKDNDKQTRDLDSIRKDLATEEELERMSFEKRRASLRSLLAAKEVSSDEFNSLSIKSLEAHNEKMEELRVGDTLTDLESVRNHLSTKSELEQAGYEDRQKKLEAALAIKKISEGEFNALTLRNKIEFDAVMNDLELGDTIADFEKYQAKLATKTELATLDYENQLFALEEFLQAEFVLTGDYHGEIEKIEQAHADRLAKIKGDKDKKNAAGEKKLWGDLTTIAQHGGKGMVQAVEVANKAQALANSYLAASQVLASNMPWYAKIPAAASVLAAGLGFASSIGGSGGGGSSSTASSAAATPDAAPQVSRNTSLQLIGEVFGREQIIDLIGRINEAQEDGAIVRLV